MSISVYKITATETNDYFIPWSERGTFWENKDGWFQEGDVVRDNTVRYHKSDPAGYWLSYVDASFTDEFVYTSRAGSVGNDFSVTRISYTYELVDVFSGTEEDPGQEFLDYQNQTDLETTWTEVSYYMWEGIDPTPEYPSVQYKVKYRDTSEFTALADDVDFNAIAIAQEEWAGSPLSSLAGNDSVILPSEDVLSDILDKDGNPVFPSSNYAFEAVTPIGRRF